jgi:hypothetical protein
MFHFVPSLFSKRIHKTSKTAVAVATNAPFLSKSCNFSCWVKVAVWIVRTACNKANSIRINHVSHSSNISSAVFCDRHFSKFNLPEKTSFVKSSMCCL